jgi:hypothetical protein
MATYRSTGYIPRGGRVGIKRYSKAAMNKKRPRRIIKPGETQRRKPIRRETTTITPTITRTRIARLRARIKKEEEILRRIRAKRR